MDDQVIVIRPQDMKSLVVGDLIFRSRNDHQLTERDLEEARLHLGETEEKKKISLQKLKESLARDKDFNYRSDDAYLLRFLRYKKYDCEKAYSMLRKFYSFKKESFDLFELPSNLELILDRGLISCLPYRTENGNIVFWVDTNQWNLDEMTLCDLFKTANVYSDIITMNPSVQVNGVIGIWDLKGLTKRHLAQYFYPNNLRTLARCLQDNYPWRINRIIVVNCNKILRGIYYAFSPLIKKKIANRITLLGSDYSVLHQYVNVNILPKEYGGNVDESECRITGLVLQNMSYLNYERSSERILNS